MPRRKNNKKNGQKKETRKVVIEKVVAARKPQKKKNRSRRRKSSSSGNPVSAAYGAATSVKQFSQRSLTIEGCDLLATISVNSGDPATGGSAILGSVDLNPALMIPGGRLSRFAELFDKYQYKELDVFFVTNVGTTTNGCLQIAADPDPMDDYSGLTGDGLSQALVGQINNIEIPVYKNASMRVKGKEFFSMPLFVDSSSTTVDGERWSSCGKLWWASMGPLAAASSYGRLFIRYKITFMEPSNDAESASGESFIMCSGGGSYITSAYPWGNFTLIKDSYKAVAGLGAYERQFVTFYSDATLGSVIRFNSEGYYLVKIFRTGAAMGTGAFSAAVLTDCSAVWPDNETEMTTYNNALSNGGSTISAWYITIYAEKPGATISSTGDSGVTHSSSIVSVGKLNLTTNPAAVLSTAALSRKVNSLTALLAQLKAASKSAPAPALGVSALDVSETATITTPGLSGGPATVSTVTLAGTVENGLEAVNVVTAPYQAPRGWQLVPKSSVV